MLAISPAKGCWQQVQRTLAIDNEVEKKVQRTLAVDEDVD